MSIWYSKLGMRAYCVKEANYLLSSLVLVILCSGAHTLNPRLLAVVLGIRTLRSVHGPLLHVRLACDKHGFTVNDVNRVVYQEESSQQQVTWTYNVSDPMHQPLTQPCTGYLMHRLTSHSSCSHPVPAAHCPHDAVKASGIAN